MSRPAESRIPISASLEIRAQGVPALLDLLRQERSALQLGEDERWNSLSRQKLPLLRDLGDLLTHLEASPSSLTPPTRQSLQVLLAECLRLLNRDNGVLLETRASRARQRLHKLKGAAGHYDGRGRERFSLTGSVRGQA